LRDYQDEKLIVAARQFLRILIVAGKVYLSSRFISGKIAECRRQAVRPVKPRCTPRWT
jgi:uncharacterized membrane protein AbrB (regulator of aidB expression)